MAIFSQLNKNRTHRLFVQTHQEVLRYLLVIFLSFVLIGIDAGQHHAYRVRHALSLFVSPIQYFSDYPTILFHKLCLLFKEHQSLINENTALREQQLQLKARLQKMTMVNRENQELKDLMSMSNWLNHRSSGARVLSLDVSPIRQLIMINQGSRNKTFIGQPVLDQNGLLGQIIDVGYMTSTVMLITDAMSAVPVRNLRTGETGILMGNNQKDKLFLMHLPITSDISVGDLLITSGLGQRYPEGYPVGKVTEIISTPGDEFMKVSIAPIAKLENSRLVLLVWPKKEELLLTHRLKDNLRIPGDLS